MHVHWCVEVESTSFLHLLHLCLMFSPIHYLDHLVYYALYQLCFPMRQILNANYGLNGMENV